MNFLELYCELYDKWILKQKADTCKKYYLAKIGNEASQKIYHQNLYDIPEVLGAFIPLFLPGHHKRMVQQANEYIYQNIQGDKNDIELFVFELLNKICESLLDSTIYTASPRILYHQRRYLQLWSMTYDDLCKMSPSYTASDKKMIQSYFRDIPPDPKPTERQETPAKNNDTAEMLDLLKRMGVKITVEGSSDEPKEQK